jgi:hypothetical protein
MTLTLTALTLTALTLTLTDVGSLNQVQDLDYDSVICPAASISCVT